MTITSTAPIVRENSADKFNVKLNQFEGPFDLLLSLIAKHELEVTALALHIVTDDFLQYIKNQGNDWDLDEATEFLVIAATLLDLKTARLLPSGEVEDEEDIARLEARDLLFARLMQYKAFKDVSIWLNDQLLVESKRFARSVSLEPQFANLLPEVLLGLGPNELARLAARALEVKVVPSISLSHLHAPTVSVQEQALIIVERLRTTGLATFRSLITGVGVAVIVARFLAILELFRESQINLEQENPRADLYIRWIGAEYGEVTVTNEFDLINTQNPILILMRPNNPMTDNENIVEEVPSIGAPSLKAGIEAILLVVDEPVSAITLAQITNSPEIQVNKTLKMIQKEFDNREGGITLREIAGGWRFYTNEHSGEVVERFLKDGQTARLTQASLETLAVIAYKQPVSRGRIAAIRGVNVDGVVRTLLNRGLIEEAGSDNESQAVLYRTTQYFLERVGVANLEELPPVADYLPNMAALDSIIDESIM